MGWHEGFLPAPHDHVFVRRLGDVDDGAPPIVLLHGFSDSGECWMPLVPHIASRGVVSMPDARGHGRSGLPDESITPEALADDVAAVIAALGRPAVVVGHSMGADTAARLAERHAELVLALVLEDPPWRETGPELHPELGVEMVGSWIDDLQSYTEAELVERCHAENPVWADAELGPWARSKLAFTREFLDHPQLWRFRGWEGGLARISCPAVLVTGDVSRGAIVSGAVAARATALQPRVQHITIAGAAHCIRRDRPVEYVAALNTFLDALG
jgi:lipase